MPSTTSRWMSRSYSRASASMFTVTVPSMEFSMATKPRSVSPLSTAASTSAKVPIGTSSWLARSGCDRRACSVKVPSGPRKPTRRSGPGAASSVTRRNATGVDEAAILQLLADVRSGELHPDDAVVELRRLPFADIGFARVDHHRALRQGMAEAVYGPGKAPEHAAAIVTELLRGGAAPVLLTRVDDVQAEAALAANPGGQRHGDTIVWSPAAWRPERVVVCKIGRAHV